MGRKKEWEYMIYAWNKRLSENDLQIATRKRDVSQFLHIFINYVVRRHPWSNILAAKGEGIKNWKRLTKL